MRRASNPYKEVKPANNRLSVAVRAQQRHSPRGANGERSSKASKAKEKKESKEKSESSAKNKVEDKVSHLEAPPLHFPQSVDLTVRCIYLSAGRSGSSIWERIV